MIAQFGRYQLGRGYSPRTVKRREMTLTGFSRSLEPATLADATLSDIEEWLASKASVRTRHAYRSDLRVFYAWAVKRDVLATDPTEHVESVRVPKSLPRPVGNDVHVALLTGTLRTRRMVALGLYAGLRCAEIAALDGGDMGTGSEAVLVVRNGKGGKDRVVPMHAELVAIMTGVGAGAVFPGRGHAHVSSGAVSRTIRSHLQRCGIDATAHQLRHSFGTEMARASKGNLVAVAAVMGHESIQTTRGYVGWTGESAAIVASMFGGDAA